MPGDTVQATTITATAARRSRSAAFRLAPERRRAIGVRLQPACLPASRRSAPDPRRAGLGAGAGGLARAACAALTGQRCRRRMAFDAAGLMSFCRWQTRATTLPCCAAGGRCGFATDQAMRVVSGSTATVAWAIQLFAIDLRGRLPLPTGTWLRAPPLPAPRIAQGAIRHRHDDVCAGPLHALKNAALEHGWRSGRELGPARWRASSFSWRAAATALLTRHGPGTTSSSARFSGLGGQPLLANPQGVAEAGGIDRRRRLYPPSAVARHSGLRSTDVPDARNRPWRSPSTAAWRC
jgi:hypothetical protein